MTAASIQKLKVEFGGNLLFQDVSFDINEGDRVGLIGANGTGKTTLFRILTGQLEPTDGGAFISKNTKIGYLEQHACSGSVRTVYDEALSSFDRLIEMETELERISRILEGNPDDREELILRQTALQEQFNADDGLI